MCAKGKLIVIDGLDGSGKTTQMKLLSERLSASGQAVLEVKFPDYSSPSSALVQMYLNGEIAQDPTQVNPYAASAFYASDRYISYYKKYASAYQKGNTLLCDRYVGSNAIYQMPKLPRTEWNTYLQWLYDFEFGKLALPRPDMMLYLDMLPEVSAGLLMKRYQGHAEKKDIHERNLQFLQQCREAALFAAQADGWKIIRCCDGIRPLPIAVIAEKIDEALAEN